MTTVKGSVFESRCNHGKVLCVVGHLYLRRAVFARPVPELGKAVDMVQHRPSHRSVVPYHLAGTPHHVKMLEVQGDHHPYRHGNWALTGCLVTGPWEWGGQGVAHWWGD